MLFPYGNNDLEYGESRGLETCVDLNVTKPLVIRAITGGDPARFRRN